MCITKLNSRYQGLWVCTNLGQVYIVWSISAFTIYLALEGFHVGGEIRVGMPEVLEMRTPGAGIHCVVHQYIHLLGSSGKLSYMWRNWGQDTRSFKYAHI